MWHCSFCNYVSDKKWNGQEHEKRMHPTQLENLNNQVQNKQNNNDKINTEEGNIPQSIKYLKCNPKLKMKIYF